MSPTRELKLLSVVAPMYNEEATAAAFYERVSAALEGLPLELVLVDDGSSDGTAKILDDLAAERPAGARSCACRATSATRRRSRPASTTRAATPWS